MRKLTVVESVTLDDLRGLSLVLAQATGRESFHRGAEQHAEVRRVEHAERSAAVGELGASHW